MSARSEILNGMKMALWKSATDARIAAGRAPRHVSTKVVAAEQDAALRAAEDLAKLYEVNMAAAMGQPVRLEHYYEAQRGTGDRQPYRFGYRIGELATSRSGDEWLDDVRIPTFEIRFARKGDELEWSGSVETAPDVGGGPYRNPRSPHDVDHVKTIAEVREILAGPTPRNARRCSPDCPGWGIFETHDRGDVLLVCDECNSLRAPAFQLSDADVQQLPEAQKALREAVAQGMEGNPRGEGWDTWYEITWPVNRLGQPDPNGDGENSARYPQREVEPMLRWLQSQGIHERLRRVEPVKESPAPKINPPARIPTDLELGAAIRYVESEYTLKDGNIDGEQIAEGLAFGRPIEGLRMVEPTEYRDLVAWGKDFLKKTPEHLLRELAARADHLRREQNEEPRYAAFGPDTWQRPAGRPPGVPNPRRR